MAARFPCLLSVLVDAETTGLLSRFKRRDGWERSGYTHPIRPRRKDRFRLVFRLGQACPWPEAGGEGGLWSMTSVGPGFKTWS